MTIPHAIFGGLALIAISIYFSVGSLPVTAGGHIQKIAICDESGYTCLGTPDGMLPVYSYQR